MNKEIIEKIKAVKNAAELKELAIKNGFNLTDEEANSYFKMYHTNGKVGENELDNVAGGACTQIIHCRAYGGDNDLLMVAQFNSCDGFEAAYPENGENCLNCKYVSCPNGGVLYCTKRNVHDDPYNPIIGTKRKKLPNGKYW